MKIRLILSLLLGAITFIFVACDRSKPPKGGMLIDADVPGTKVFYKDNLLGTVPVRLSAGDLKSLGIPKLDDKQMRALNDSWGEGMFIGNGDEVQYKIHFLVPYKPAYVTAQTRWGDRTRLYACETSPNYFRAFLYPKARGELQLSMALVDRTATELKISITATNASSTKTVTCSKADFDFLWGAADEPWSKRECDYAQAPSSWKVFTPKTAQTTIVTLPLEKLHKGASLFTVLNLFADPEGNKLTGTGAIYGESIWIAE